MPPARCQWLRLCILRWLAGLLVAEPCNRRGTCWRIDELLLEEELQSRTDTTILLIREVIQRVPGALSWIARAGSSDTPVLAALREQGFQTLQQQQVWRLNSAENLQACPQMPGQLKLEELNSTNSALLLQLELSATPSLLRQMQDLRREDLLDDARSGSLLLVDSQRHQAVAAARLSGAATVTAWWKLSVRLESADGATAR